MIIIREIISVGRGTASFLPRDTTGFDPVNSAREATLDEKC
jgi:hypothetical protein